MEIKIHYTSEFETACDLLYWKPEEILQAFINQVSLAKYHSKEQKDNNYIATSFLLNHSNKNGDRLVPAKKIHEKYSKKLKELQGNDTNDSFEDRYIRLLHFFSEWRTDVIKNMSEKDFVIDVKERKRRLGID